MHSRPPPRITFSALADSLHWMARIEVRELDARQTAASTYWPRRRAFVASVDTSFHAAPMSEGETMLNRGARDGEQPTVGAERGHEFNRSAAELLRRYATLLAQQRSSPFRVNAYLRAAQTLESLDRDARTLLVEGGIDAITALPSIGVGIAQAINEIAQTGRLARLERLVGGAEPELLLRFVPGIGPTLARKLHEELDVHSLEDFEVAAHDGRLERIAGIGPRRAAALRASLASVLGRPASLRPTLSESPAVDLLLDVDREYRGRAVAGDLPLIAPRRFNPQHEAWLPILHTDRGPLHFTALYSNTARAHELERTRDWVVLYFYDGDHREGQCTVVTETHGKLRGRRVVRGREAECAAHYGPAGVPERRTRRAAKT